MRKTARVTFFFLLVCSLIACDIWQDLPFDRAFPPSVAGTPQNLQLFFSMASDTEEYLGPAAGRTGHEFRAALIVLNALPPPDGGSFGGAGDFFVSTGDTAPLAEFRAALDEKLGSSLPWFPIAGNHETGTSGSMSYLRAYAANYITATNYSPGPAGAAETCYSFDGGPAHFVFLNEYFDGSSDTGASGDIVPELLSWVESDFLAAEMRDPDYIFVVGHEPLLPMPDAYSGRVRHRGDSLDAHAERTKAFIRLLNNHGVSAYICGHSHGYSTWLIDKLLQIDTGHARGEGDTGAPSTILRMSLYDNMAVLEAYRNTDYNGRDYPLVNILRIAPRLH